MFEAEVGDPRSSGIGTTVESAAYIALGEFIERYCAAIFALEANFTFGTYDELSRKGHRLVDPERTPLFSERQYATPNFPFVPFTRTTPLAWCEGVSLVTGEPVLVPRQLVLLTDVVAPGEPRIAYATSTGAACGPTIEEALLSGLYEYVERDAVVIAWYSHAPPREVDVATSPKVSRFLAERMPATTRRAAAHVVDISTDIPIPVFFGLYEDFTGRGVRAHVAASCRLDPEAAAIKTILELAQGVMYLKMCAATMRTETNPAAFNDLEKNVLFYGTSNHFEHLEFLLKGGPKVPFSEIPNRASGSPRKDIRTVVEALDERGFEPIAMDVSTPDARALDLHVTRVYVPGLASLGVPALPYLGCPRLREIPHRVGRAKRALTEDELFLSAPHPFP